MNFRDIEHHLIIVVDPRNAAFLSENTPGANSLLCYGYIDKTAGLTYEVLAAAEYIEGDYSVIWNAEDVSMKVRADAFENAELILPIENKVLERRFSDRIRMIEEGYYSGDPQEATRQYTILDEFRHPGFPDDINVILFKQGLKPERIWVRCKEFLLSDNGRLMFNSKLLNEPYSDFGIHIGDDIYFLAYEEDGQNIAVAIPTAKQ